MTTKVGVIGLGDIGRGVATNIVRAGLELVVCDVKHEATPAFAEKARIAHAPDALSELVDVVVVAVVDDSQLIGGAHRAERSARLGATRNLVRGRVDGLALDG